jgi:hypothetical protein
MRKTIGHQLTVILKMRPSWRKDTDQSSRAGVACTGLRAKMSARASSRLIDS